MAVLIQSRSGITRYLVLSQFGSRKERETENRRKECERNVAEGRNGNYRRQRK